MWSRSPKQVKSLWWKKPIEVRTEETKSNEPSGEGVQNPEPQQGERPVRRRRSRKTVDSETTETANMEREVKEPKDGELKTQPEGFDEVEKVVREACDKYGQKEIFALVRDRFGIRKFSELDPKQYPDVIEVVKSYGQAEVTDTEESLF